MTAELRTPASAHSAPVNGQRPALPDASLSQQLAALVAATRADDIPADVLENAAWWVLDWLGAAVAGLDSAPGRILVEHTGGQPASGASCIGLREGRSAQVAALHNGAVSHVVEMDDVHRGAIIHPAVVVVPAALAVAEQRGASGRDFLAAVVVGYEVAIRVGESVGKTHYFHWHNTGTCGVFGAAAAAGWLLGLDEERLTWTLGNAGTQAGGLWEFIADGAMSKFLHAGRAAANGVLAAELGALGFTGARRILEGRQGFFAATAPDGDPATVTADLGQGWKLPGSSIKPYPSCRHTHAAVDATLALREAHGLNNADVDGIEIDAYQSTIDLTDNATPATPYAAKFSVQYCVARALADGAVKIADFSPRRISEPAVRTLMQRTVVRLDPDLDARAPAQLPARVRLTLHDGRTVEETILDAKGDPEAPLTHAELAAKFLDLIAGTAYAGRGQALLATITSLAERPDVRGLLTLPA
ncbi:MAG: MmgE/PrpD family protein [Chloroflexi bacterium]|nr:MmgE/PrpD family protein [Chloroflexota bacterium]